MNSDGPARRRFTVVFHLVRRCVARLIPHAENEGMQFVGTLPRVPNYYPAIDSPTLPGAARKLLVDSYRDS